MIGAAAVVPGPFKSPPKATFPNTVGVAFGTADVELAIAWSTYCLLVREQLVLGGVHCIISVVPLIVKLPLKAPPAKGK